VTDLNGLLALYFSRSPVAYPRRRENLLAVEQIGVHSFRKDFFSKFAKMKPIPLEKTELLEMLRALENDYKI
jgi:3-deoxy-manno-octulosonate cytidylyltransferase (CMP-KDO synthetase)